MSNEIMENMKGPSRETSIMDQKKRILRSIDPQDNGYVLNAIRNMQPDGHAHKNRTIRPLSCVLCLLSSAFYANNFLFPGPQTKGIPWKPSALLKDH